MVAQMIYQALSFILAETAFGCALWGLIVIVDLLKSDSVKYSIGAPFIAILVLPTPIWLLFPKEWVGGTAPFLMAAAVAIKMLAVWMVYRWLGSNLSDLQGRLIEERKAKMRVLAQAYSDDTYASMKRNLN